MRNKIRIRKSNFEENSHPLWPTPIWPAISNIYIIELTALLYKRF